MKIVIEVSEKDYLNFILQYDNGILDEKTPSHRAKIAIANGTPLPKGHGALKDATTLKKMFEDKEGDDFTAFHFYDAIEECPTIVEADKEGAEE